MKYLLTLLIGLFLALHYALWFGDKNVFAWYRLKHATELRQQENLALQQHNDQLIAEVNDLKEGGETVETIARSQFGLIKKHETFYQIID